MSNTKDILDMIIENKDKYYITVDNDSVWVEKKGDPEFMVSFDKFGYHLLVEVLNYFDIDTNYC